MKKNILLILFIAVPNLIAAQKPKPKEKAPTQAEMQQMMNELQKEIKKMTPEEKKMMEEMGVKIPSLKELPKASDKELAAAWDDEDRIIPQKDNARIAAIQTSITDARMKLYITEVHKKTAVVLQQDAVKVAQAIKAYSAKEKMSAEDIGNIATALWQAGKPQEAVYVMGVACADSLSANNLNNYASMLTMMDGEHLAIPVLENLLAKMPDNVILLNNLGQAWFGLGDVDKAEKYLNKALDIYPTHPQATFTKAEIAESKGDISAAVVLLKKSVKETYSDEKRNKLKKLGYQLQEDDVDFPFRQGYDPAALDSFTRPSYPLSAADAKVMKPQWDEFVAVCHKQIKELKAELKQATAAYNHTIQTMPMGLMSSANGTSLQVPLFAARVVLKMKGLDIYYKEMVKTLMEEKQACRKDLDYIKQQRKTCVAEADCTCFKDAENAFLNMYNTRKKTTDEKCLKLLKKWYADVAYWNKYTSMNKEQEEMVRLEMLINMIKEISSSEYLPEFPDNYYEDCDKQDLRHPFRLRQFDLSKGCQFHGSINYGIYKEEYSCSYITSTFDLEFLKNLPVFGIGVKNTWVNNHFEFVRSTMVISPKLNLTTAFLPAPAYAGFTAEGNITINTDKDGNKNWDATVKAGIELGVGKSLGALKTKLAYTEGFEVEMNSTDGLKDIRFVQDISVKGAIEIPKLDKDNPDVKSALPDKEITDFNDKTNSTNNAGKLLDMTVKVGVQQSVSLMSGSQSVKGSVKLRSVKVTK